MQKVLKSLRLPGMVQVSSDQVSGSKDVSIVTRNPDAADRLLCSPLFHRLLKIIH